MDRQENKAIFDYQNFINYNHSQWSQNGYQTPIYANNIDPAMNGQNNSTRPMSASIPQPMLNNGEYYQYGLFQTPQLRNNSATFTADNKNQYRGVTYPYDNGSVKDQPSGGAQVSGPMRKWLNSHITDPYPSSQEKNKLSIECRKSYIQVCTWFANARRSLRRQGILGQRVRRNKAYENYESTDRTSVPNNILNSESNAFNNIINSSKESFEATEKIPSTNSQTTLTTFPAITRNNS